MKVKIDVLIFNTIVYSFLCQTDQRQRMMLQRLTENVEGLLAVQGPRSAPPLPPHPDLPPRPDLPPLPDDLNEDNNVLRQVKKLVRKLTAVDSLIQGGMQKVSNEVSDRDITSVKMRLGQHSLHKVCTVATNSRRPGYDVKAWPVQNCKPVNAFTNT